MSSNCAQAELSAVDLVGLPSMAKAVEIRRALEQAEMRSRQRVWAERGAQALAAAEDMPDDEGIAGRWARAPIAASTTEVLFQTPP